MTRKEDITVHLAMGGVASLLVLLLLITPSFNSWGLSVSGTLLSHGEMVVDYIPNQNGTANGTATLYVGSPGNVRFISISIGVVNAVPSLPVIEATPGHWVWHNTTNQVMLSVVLVNVTSFMVNVTAIYERSPTLYYIYTGLFSFQVLLSAGTLTADPLSPSMPTTGPARWSFEQLPQSIALAETTGASP